jgi:hypothetical protein
VKQLGSNLGLKKSGGLALALALVSACTAGGNHSSSPGPNQAGSAGSSAGGSSSAGGAGPSIQVGMLTQTCSTSQLGRPLLRRLTAGELKRTLEDIFPEVQGQWSVAISESKSSLGFYNDPAILSGGGQVAEKLLDTADALATALTAEAVLPKVLPCSATTPDRACAQTFLSTYGRRLFRRALTQAEQDNYLAFFDAQLQPLGFRGAMRWLLVGLIQSPNALYRREIGAHNGDTYQLSQQEIATELAYTFTGSTPTPELLAQADQGMLQTPEQLTAAATALMATPAGNKQLHSFFESWLSYLEVPPTRPNIADYASVAPDLLQETHAFIEEVIVNGRGGYKELLTAPFTTPSAKLASFYGFPAPAADYAKVERPAGRGKGVLAQGSVLVAHSHEASSSPTLRGLLVFERLLCGTRPQVPPNVPTLSAPSPGVKTTRQRYEEQHMAAGSACPACHKQFDPLGFAFEHYDEAGRYRADEAGLPIDSSGAVSDDGQQAFTFTDEDDLATNLATLEKVGKCASGYLSVYAYANAVPCLAETRRPEFIAGTLGYVDYLASLAAEPTFTQRQ